ncbi:hypothetical protein HB364_04945 [Pseudoflavitalea sp. X16]|uniref:hypothetical protein n=1 Tax=Paraflavitalea devenefica TaxID=2716334 RepID=UPI0014208DAA|nr:hypothetical protein [Paraflavitalea devenefica]NII24411.1 hypothetical protein [Paraflavitalea devenefica]
MNVLQRFYKIIVALAFSLKMLMLQAQQNQPPAAPIAVVGPVSASSHKPWRLAHQSFFNKSPQSALTNRPFTANGLPGSLVPTRWPAQTTVIGQNFYTQHFGFFCRQELRLEKASGLPLRFRLGSLKDCNYLEGK